MFVSAILAAAVAASGPATIGEWRQQCAGKEEDWSAPAPPLHVFGNVYDVGTCGITVLLLTSKNGHVLLDAATAEAAPSIAANIERLGFRLRDVKLIGGSHEHLDHVGGVAELQRLTGATVMALPAAFNTFETGVVDRRDPQSGLHKPFPGAKVGRILRDGLTVGTSGLRLTAHATPGHAPGSTTWTWRSCEAGRCINVVYADSLTAVSSDAYRFRDHPRYLADFRASIRKIAALPCDLLITPHPSASKFIERMSGEIPLVGPGLCRAYARRGRIGLDERIDKESASS
jgi:metallo-beta-lactamase class B